jgi:hypothetical protein
MYLSYFDETGDDGYPKYSSKLFVLTSIYMHHQNWKDNFSILLNLRKTLKSKFNLPIKVEIHTKQLILNKNPYRELNLSTNDRVLIMKEISLAISSLEIQSVNVCIDKIKINEKNSKRYKNILDSALNFNIQRIENDLRKKDPGTKFIMITDEGRVGKMRMTTRKIQTINFIPSRYSPESYRNEIKLLIEDPLPKNSKESFFIQIVDFISYFIYLYSIKKEDWNNRLNWLDEKTVYEILKNIEPILNLNASSGNNFGIVRYPK